jgi:response regulator NasT
VEIALGRFKEMRTLEAEVRGLEDQLEIRRLVDRAKGKLMDEHAMAEAQAFNFIQKTAMRERQTMKQVAERIIAAELQP